jgi:hypothetical protein
MVEGRCAWRRAYAASRHHARLPETLAGSHVLALAILMRQRGVALMGQSTQDALDGVTFLLQLECSSIITIMLQLEH